MAKPKQMKLFMSRVIFVVLCLLIQLGWLISVIWKLSRYYWIFSAVLSIISIIMVLWIVNKRDNPANKLIWTIVILTIPIFGSLFYLFAGNSRVTRKIRYKLDAVRQELNGKLVQDERVISHLDQVAPSAARIHHYISNVTGNPVYENTQSEYFPTGEAFFEALKTELRKAEHFIFMEFFAIQEGVMWNSILDILIEKVKQGVEVRVIYDDVGSVALLPYKYHEILNRLGIRCRAFNPFIPLLSVMMNHRDHRKIAVIDGHTCFTGGANLTDQYINVVQPYGQWKDAAVMLRGEAVWSMTAMFLQIWNGMWRTDADFDLYRPKLHQTEPITGSGFVQPYDDNPLDDETVGENVYLHMINRAKKYLYIFTPYLIIDNEMMTGLCLAAKSGVDVRIMTPRIPDKKLVFLLTQSYYSQLIDGGVKIYEYTPGFLHSKCFLCDGEMGTVGTINLDYRSLYHHFECGVFLYRTDSLKALEKDFNEAFSIGTEITKEFCEGRHWWIKVSQSILRLAAPLL